MRKLLIALGACAALVPAMIAVAAAGETPSFPKEWQGEWCFHTDSIKRHVPARAGMEAFDATVARSFYKRKRCKEDQKITIKRNRYSSAERVCQLTTAHIEETGAHVSILELGGMVKCDADVDDHIRVSVMTLGYKSRRSDSLSVEFDGEITPYEGD